MSTSSIIIADDVIYCVTVTRISNHSRKKSDRSLGRIYGQITKLWGKDISNRRSGDFRFQSVSLEQSVETR